MLEAPASCSTYWQRSACPCQKTDGKGQICPVSVATVVRFFFRSQLPATTSFFLSSPWMQEAGHGTASAVHMRGSTAARSAAAGLLLLALLGLWSARPDRNTVATAAEPPTAIVPGVRSSADQLAAARQRARLAVGSTDTTPAAGRPNGSASEAGPPPPAPPAPPPPVPRPAWLDKVLRQLERQNLTRASPRFCPATNKTVMYGRWVGQFQLDATSGVARASAPARAAGQQMPANTRVELPRACRQSCDAQATPFALTMRKRCVCTANLSTANLVQAARDLQISASDVNVYYSGSWPPIGRQALRQFVPQRPRPPQQPPPHFYFFTISRGVC